MHLTSRTLLALALTASCAEPASLHFAKEGHLDCGDVLTVSEGTIELWFKPASRNNNEWVAAKGKDRDNCMVLGFGPKHLLFQIKM